MQTIARQIAELTSKRNAARARRDHDAAYRIGKRIIVLTCQYETARRAAR